jgi:tocopherol cyclase
MQTNHFSNPGTSFKASVAKIPWIRSAFIGFIAGLWWNNKLYRFTTYNNTSLHKCLIDKDHVENLLSNRKYELSILAHRDHATALASPLQGMMDGRIEESMTSSVEVTLSNLKTKSVIFQ